MNAKILVGFKDLEPLLSGEFSRGVFPKVAILGEGGQLEKVDNPEYEGCKYFVAIDDGAKAEDLYSPYVNGKVGLGGGVIEMSEDEKMKLAWCLGEIFNKPEESVFDEKRMLEIKEEVRGFMARHGVDIKDGPWNQFGCW